jgi:AcrR family transcriptional regulator
VQALAKSAYQEAILDAAERVFVRDGFHSAKMAAIALESGVSVGTLYNYFPSKVEVFAALARRGHAQFFALLEEGSSHGEPVCALREGIKRALGFLEERGLLFALSTQVNAQGDTEVCRIAGIPHEDTHGRFQAWIRGHLARCIEARMIRNDYPPEILAASLGGMLNGALIAWLRDERRDSLVMRADLVVDLFMQGARSQ